MFILGSVDLAPEGVRGLPELVGVRQVGFDCITINHAGSHSLTFGLPAMATNLPSHSQTNALAIRSSRSLCPNTLGDNNVGNDG